MTGSRYRPSNKIPVERYEKLYIDNTEMFVEVAQDLGIKCILHTDYKSTRAELASCGLEVTE